MRVDDARLQEEVLQETADPSADSKALALRLVHQYAGNVALVAAQTGLPRRLPTRG